MHPGSPTAWTSCPHTDPGLASACLARAERPSGLRTRLSNSEEEARRMDYDAKGLGFAGLSGASRAESEGNPGGCGLGDAGGAHMDRAGAGKFIEAYGGRSATSRARRLFNDIDRCGMLLTGSS